MRILIVDDSAFFQQKLSEFLQDSGYGDLLFASNGLEALAMLAAQDQAKEPVGLILSDVFMPVLDGLKFRERVRSAPQSKDIPFLMISGYDNLYTYPVHADLRIEGFMKKSEVTGKLLQWITYFSAPVSARACLPRPDTVKASAPD